MSIVPTAEPPFRSVCLSVFVATVGEDIEDPFVEWHKIATLPFGFNTKLDLPLAD
jgi:hypothetical protein